MQLQKRNMDAEATARSIFQKEAVGLQKSGSPTSTPLHRFLVSDNLLICHFPQK
jgi:hypothetical protein